MTVNGRLASDVTRQVSKQGTEFINFSLANTEFGDPKSSDGVTQTQWFRVTSFNSNHIKLAKYLTKGKPITVVGRYSNRLYQSQRTGQWGIDNDIIATDIFFEIGSERNEDGSPRGNNSTQNGGTSSSSTPNNETDSIPQVTSTKMGVQPTPQSVSSTSVQVNDGVNDDDDLPF